MGDKYWTGDVGSYDVCKVTLRGDFYDARTFDGPWATLCTECYRS